MMASPSANYHEDAWLITYDEGEDESMITEEHDVHGAGVLVGPSTPRTSWFPSIGGMLGRRGGGSDKDDSFDGGATGSACSTPRKSRDCTKHSVAGDTASISCSTQWSLGNHDDDTSFDPSTMAAAETPATNVVLGLDESSEAGDGDGFRLVSPDKSEGPSGLGEIGIVDFGGVLDSRFSYCVAPCDDDDSDGDEYEADDDESASSSECHPIPVVTPTKAPNQVVLESVNEQRGGESDGDSYDDVVEESLNPLLWDSSSDDEGSREKESGQDDDEDASLTSDEGDVHTSSEKEETEAMLPHGRIAASREFGGLETHENENSSVVELTTNDNEEVDVPSTSAIKAPYFRSIRINSVLLLVSSLMLLGIFMGAPLRFSSPNRNVASNEMSTIIDSPPQEVKGGSESQENSDHMGFEGLIQVQPKGDFADQKEHQVRSSQEPGPSQLVANISEGTCLPVESESLLGDDGGYFHFVNGAKLKSDCQNSYEVAPVAAILAGVDTGNKGLEIESKSSRKVQKWTNASLREEKEVDVTSLAAQQPPPVQESYSTSVLANSNISIGLMIESVSSLDNHGKYFNKGAAVKSKRTHEVELPLPMILPGVDVSNKWLKADKESPRNDEIWKNASLTEAKELLSPPLHKYEAAFVSVANRVEKSSHLQSEVLKRRAEDDREGNVISGTKQNEELPQNKDIGVHVEVDNLKGDTSWWSILSEFMQGLEDETFLFI